MKKDRNALLAFLAILSLATWVVVRILFAIGFDWNCEQNLKRAADANTVALAAQELTTVIKYLEENGRTHGNTGIFFHVPKNDTAFFYNNLKASLEEIQSSMENPASSPLEKSNLLIKLRETILDQEGGENSGMVVTCPDGISVAPHNRLFAFWAFASLVAIFYFGRKIKVKKSKAEPVDAG